MSEQTVGNTTVTEENVTPQAESISLADLQTLLQIVDLGAERGAFKGSELSQVGATRDKLNAFLVSVAAAQEAAKESAEETQSVDQPVGE